MSQSPKITTVRGSNIPESLQTIPQSPKKLHIIGKLPDPEKYTYLCVVGSRKCTPYGQSVCEKLLEGLRGYPIVIVSGLAFGIDAIAHDVALATGLKTVSFPGSGLAEKAIHPASHRQLANEIVQAGGALVSEFDHDERAAYWTFPARNRLMAGISRAILVIEAEHESGTLITADLALQYGRDVFSVPGSIFSETSFGTNNLIKQGAVPITHSAQLLEELGFAITKRTPEEMYVNCSDDERMVLELLVQPMQRSELVRALPTETHAANVLLSAMEIKGLITEKLGKIYRK